MFDRMASVNTESSAKRFAARVTLMDGTALAGAFVATGHGDLASYLNAERSFLRFEPAEGGESFLSRQSIARIDPVNAQKATQLDKAIRAADRFDAYEVLGLAPDATRDDVRAAYHTRVKAYHPDRIAGLDLPKEMVDYSAAMLSRVNAAYDQLCGREAPVSAGEPAPAWQAQSAYGRA